MKGRAGPRRVQGSHRHVIAITGRENRLAARRPAKPALCLMQHAILLYDGVCGLCGRIVQFVLDRDKSDVFRFAPLQGEVAMKALQARGCALAELSTVILVLNPQQSNERLLVRSDAALETLVLLGIPWNLLSLLGRLCPRSLRDRIYEWIAHRRYRMFGRLEACAIPTEAQQRKFLSRAFLE